MEDYNITYFNTSTQDDMDVSWDWSSPRSKQCIRPHPKRLIPSQSPKLTLKRHPSNNQVPKFDQIKQEIEALRSGIASTNNKVQDNDTNSCKKSSKNQKYFDDFDDEAIDEQLILCSQLVEREVNTINTTCTNVIKPLAQKEINEYDSGTPKKHKHHLDGIESTSGIKKLNMNPTPSTILNCRSTENVSILEKNKPFLSESSSHDAYMNKNARILGDLIADDSFDLILNHLDNNALHIPSVDISDNKEPQSDKIQKTIIFERHKSFESAAASSKNEESPIKCSPEEIEQKRLQAIAKLQAKKKQEIIERNRQEALKRLELSKKKKAVQSQFGLPRRVHR